MADDQADTFVKEILEPFFHPNDATLNSVLSILALAAFGYAKGSEKIFLLCGCGRNFKTKLMELMRAVLGMYSKDYPNYTNVIDIIRFGICCFCAHSV